MKLGIVDLDTSHPPAWIPIERELGHAVLGVWDGGEIHPRGYAERFATEHHIPRVYATLAEMAREVDGAIIHSCNWDTHLANARVFLEAGKSVLLDKPLAGNRRDLGMRGRGLVRAVVRRAPVSVQTLEVVAAVAAQPLADGVAGTTEVLGRGLNPVLESRDDEVVAQRELGIGDADHGGIG